MGKRDCYVLFISHPSFAIRACQKFIYVYLDILLRRVVCSVLISDTHNKHEELGELPAGDVLIHAGDFAESTRPPKPEVSPITAYSTCGSFIKWHLLINCNVFSKC